jgi:hypothetical protein
LHFGIGAVDGIDLGTGLELGKKLAVGVWFVTE